MEIVLLGLLGTTALGLAMSVRIVPQSATYVIERFGKFRCVLKPGIHMITPGVDYVAHKVDILERMMPARPIDAITKDNVQIQVVVSTFYRVINPELAVYRIRDVENGISATVIGIIRTNIGKIDFDELQSDREKISKSLEEGLGEAATGWGVEVTRSEIIDVTVDEDTRRAMSLQMNAERERRATVTKAEGEKRAAELRADAEYYTSEKTAGARRIAADAEAYAAETLAKSMQEGGAAAFQVELTRQQIKAIETLGSSPNTKIVMLPSDATGALAGIANVIGQFSADITK